MLRCWSAEVIGKWAGLRQITRSLRLCFHGRGSHGFDREAIGGGGWAPGDSLSGAAPAGAAQLAPRSGCQRRFRKADVTTLRRLPVCKDDQIARVVSFADIVDYTRCCLDNLITEETKAEK